MVGLHVGSTGTSLWLAWDLNTVLLFGLAMVGWLYFSGLRASTGRRRRLHPWWRPAVYYVALAAIAIALVSPLDHLADELFVMHMAQHMLLMVVAPPLILLGAPMVPILRGIPRPVRRRVVAPVLRQRTLRKALKYLSLPLIAWPLYAVTLLGWHTPAAYDLALRNEAAHVLEHFSFTVTALLFWWNVIDSVPLRGNLSYIGRVPYVFLMTVPNFSLGAFLTFSEAAWYERYLAQELRWGLSAMDDQQLGGLIMWIPGALVLLTALLAVLVYTVFTEERLQREREALALVGVRGAIR